MFKSSRLSRIKEMKRLQVVIGVEILVILAGVLLTLHLHHESKTEVLSQFRDHQLAHIQHLANQIEFFFRARSQELQVLSSLLSHEAGDMKEKKAAIEAYSKMAEYVQTIFLCNGRGKIIYSTDSNAIGLDYGEREFFSWAKKKENKGKVSGLSLSEGDSSIFLLTVPLYRDSSDENRPEPGEKFDGVVTVAVDLKKFLADRLYFLAPEINVNQVWIMDKDGKLLLQSGHRGVGKRNIHQGVESCQGCHNSFDHAEKILKAKQGTVNYELKGVARKIAAFAPVDFGDMSWVVVVNSAYDEATAVIRKSLREHLGLLGMVVLAAILGSVFLLRTDRLKVRAEEEAKHLREKRALEDRVQQSEALYRTIVENAHDAIWTLDTQGHLTFVNRRGEEISGYNVSELIGKDFQLLVPPEDLPRAKDLFLNILHGKVESFEGRFCAKDGTIRLLSVNAVPLYENGTVVGMFNIGRDITEQRNAEKALRESEKQLRYLSSQLLTAQETERRRISRELHDELGGALSVLKLRVNFIRKKLESDPVMAEEECRTISQYINQVIENVRRLSRDLSPSVLEDAGLLAAIHWLITNSKTDHKIKMILNVGDIDQLFSRDAQIIIYRILQEALTNIVRHAQAKNASLTIEGHEDEVSFSVEDDGIGFDALRVTTVNLNKGGLGLAIIEERARMLGGSLEIWSEKGKGTRITFRVPLKKGGRV